MIQDEIRALQLSAFFRRHFDSEPLIVVRAPGRVNLLGEHTDYNEGFVLPMAIDRSILVAACPRPDRLVTVWSANYHRSLSFSLDETGSLGKNGTPTRDKFSNYLRGVARCIEARGYKLHGLNAAIEGNVPVGSGLSSSAALEVAVVLAFESVSGLSIPGPEKARIGQQTENEYLGVQSGLMDQLVSVWAQKDHAVLIDCRTLSHELVSMSALGAKVVVCDSGVRRSLDKSQYNLRREECLAGVRTLSEHKPEVKSLRDVSSVDLDFYASALPEVVQRRCRHVVNENERVLEGVAALRRRDVSSFGDLMYASHKSLRDLYEVSCRELDLRVECAMRVDGVMGSRMTGAGFGGCTVSLVDSETVDEFKYRVGRDYRDATGREARIWVCQPSEGAGALALAND